MIDEERREIARAEGFGDDAAAYRAGPCRMIPPTGPRPREELVARATEDIERAAAVAADRVRPPAAGRLRGAARWRRSRSRTRRSRTTSRPPWTARARASTTSTPTTCPAAPTPSSAPPTYHEAIPGHHFQISLEMEHPSLNALPAARGAPRGWRLRRGLGPVLGAPRRRAGPVPERRPSGSGCSMRRRGAPRGSSWTPACTGWAGRGSSRWTGSSATGLSDTDANIETDRYIAWPGQALTYMTGMREIRRLRRELEARDGDRFDLRASTTSSSGTGRCRWRRSPGSCRTG